MQKVSREEYFGIVTARMPEVTKVDPKVKIMLLTGEYLLEYDNKAAIDLIADIDFNLLTTPMTGKQLKDPRMIGAILFRGLQKNHPDMTQDKANTEFDIRFYRYVVDRISESIGLIFPDMTGYEIEEEAKDTADPPKGPVTVG